MISLRYLPSHFKTALRSVREEGFDFLLLWLRMRAAVPGWLGGKDARLLYSFARRGPAGGAIVEIGSAWGRSTVVLARGSKRARREKVYAIDPHTGDPAYLDPESRAQAQPSGSSHGPCGLAPGSTAATDSGQPSFSSLPEFQQNLRHFRVDDWVQPVVSTSEEAARALNIGPIRLLFVDGLHTYQGVKRDIADWVPRVVPGGIIVFDDYFNARAGVRRAVDELLASGTTLPELRRADVLVWAVKR